MDFLLKHSKKEKKRKLTNVNVKETFGIDEETFWDESLIFPTRNKKEKGIKKNWII